MSVVMFFGVCLVQDGDKMGAASCCELRVGSNL